MATANLPGQYDSFLLRVWRDGQENEWRWMLQDIRTGEQKGFRNTDALMNFLEQKYAMRAGDGARSAGVPSSEMQVE